MAPPPPDDSPPGQKPDVLGVGPKGNEREIGTITAQLQRVIQDVTQQGSQLDELRHQITYVKGALGIAWKVAAAVGALIVLLGGWWLSGKVVVVKPPGG